MPSFSHPIGLSIGQPIGENLDGSAISAGPAVTYYYTFNGTDTYVDIPYTRIDIGTVITFKLVASANPTTSSTIFDGEASLIKMVVGTAGAMNATGGTITPTTLVTDGTLTEYTFTATSAGSIDTIGADTETASGFASQIIHDLYVDSEGWPISDGWAVNPLIKSNILNTGASNGATTYDRYLKTYFNYATEVDPKYGDVAPTLAEAQARAVEGLMPNGNFRDGTIGGWLANASATLSYDAGTIKVETTVFSGAYMDMTVVAGTPYSITITAVESGPNGRLYIFNGANFTNALLESFNRINGTQTYIVTPTVTTMRIYLANTGSAGFVNYSNIQLNTATTEIVSGANIGNGEANNFVESGWSDSVSVFLTNADGSDFLTNASGDRLTK